MVFLLGLLSVVIVAEQYDGTRDRAHVEAHRAAHVVATQFSWVLQASSQALQRIEEVVARDGLTGGQGGVAALAEAVKDLPPGYHHSVFDAEGNLALSSRLNPPRVNIGDRAYFSDLRDGARQVVGPMVRGRLSGEIVFNVARRLDHQGSFVGIASVSIPISSLEQLAASLAFTDGSTISLVALDGTILARAPPIEPMNIRGSRLFTELAVNPGDGSYETVSPADGVERIVGYWRLPDWPIVAVAARDRATALAPFWEAMLVTLLMLLPIGALVLWLMVDIQRLLRRDESRKEELAEAMDRAQFLLREIHHRVKNNLQTVISLIRLERLPTEVQERLTGRISAMVSVHEAMYRADRFSDICAGPYLRQLVEDAARSHGIPVEMEFDMTEARLSGDRAMQLGLLTNELVSNAFKHAFVPRGGGRLTVRLEEAGPDRLRLIIGDDGPGYDPQTDDAHMGTRLIEAFVGQLGGTVHVETRDHCVVTVDFPRDFREGPPRDQPAQPVSSPPDTSAGVIRLSRKGRSTIRT